jgi:G-patch domain
MMTARTRGTGSRSSPIVIDDDDDKDQPPRNKVKSGPFTALPKTPPHALVQSSVFANITKSRDSIPARRDKSDQSKNGVGYSILVRMGYKPGRGLGVNLEGIRPLSAILLGG